MVNFFLKATINGVILSSNVLVDLGGVPLQEAGVRLSVGKTSTPHSDVLQESEVLHLMAAALFFKQQRRFDVVGLDAADIVGFLGGRQTVNNDALEEALSPYDRCGLPTLLARFSTREIMEFLKSVAAVKGRLVTSVMLSLPSGHMTFITGFELDTQRSPQGRIHMFEWVNVPVFTKATRSRT